MIVFQAYLETAGPRVNLTILVNAVVTRILSDRLSDTEFRAEGVEFAVNGKQHRVFVNGEVIVCAG